MDDVVVFKTREGDNAVLEEIYLPVLEEDCTRERVLATSEEAEKHEMERGSLLQPLLEHPQQLSLYEPRQNGRADSQTPTDGADRKTSVPQEWEFDNAAQPQCSGSVRSQGSDNSARHECPICSEPFDLLGDHGLTLLNCDHTICHHCLVGILKRAKDSSRVQCPFCRQTTPSPCWEIQKMQEEVYSNSVYAPGAALAGSSGLISPGQDSPAPGQPTTQAPWSCCVGLEQHLEAHMQRDVCGLAIYLSCLLRMLRLTGDHPRCFSTTVFLMLSLLLIGYLVYAFVPVVILI